MPRLIGKFELHVVTESASVEDVRTLLQAIRDWEQARHMDIFVGIEARGMSQEETAWVFDSIEPSFDKTTFIPKSQ